MVKVFGIGNPLLGDDGIALHLIQLLWQDPLLTSKITFYLVETDCLYALEQIQPDDFIIILDSSYFKRPLGTLVHMPLRDCLLTSYVSTHSLNLLTELQLYFPKINGFFLGIEIHEIEPSLTLSPNLAKLLPQLHLEVTHLLLSLITS